MAISMLAEVSAVDSWQNPITTDETWLDALREVADWTPPDRPLVVVAPHPDDETLGAGGFIATWRRKGLPVHVLAVTDGEAAYPDFADLGTLRKREQEIALSTLGVEGENLVRLEIADGMVAGYEDELVHQLATWANRDCIIVAPWSGDFHPDHEACGRAARRVAAETGALLVEYLFWAWHRGTPATLQGLPLRRFSLDDFAWETRRQALLAHASQLSRDGGEGILPKRVLGPMDRHFEIYIVQKVLSVAA